MATTVPLTPKLTSTPLLDRIFRALDDAQISYCVTHGYESYPERVDSDVDLVVRSADLPGRLAGVLHEKRDQIGAQVVNWLAGASHFITLASRDGNGTPQYLHLHVSSECAVRHRRIVSAKRLIASRVRRGSFWIPSPRHEFCYLLARRIEKGNLSNEHAQHLSELYERDPVGCRGQLAQLFSNDSIDLICGAAFLRMWDPFIERLTALRKEMMFKATTQRLPRVAWNYLSGAARLIGRRIRADRGLNVVLLGPDGSGKSSVVSAMRQDLAGAFVATERRTFPPALLQRSSTSSSTPHAVVPRSWNSSTVRAVCYWLVYYTLGYPFTVGKSLSQATLVIHDRHLVDCLVDPKRYRYGGPMMLLKFIWRCVVKPDLVILLDAPAAVIQARKQEVPLEETERQSAVYRELVSHMPFGRVIDASRSIVDVTSDVNELVLRFLAKRHARRFNL